MSLTEETDYDLDRWLNKWRFILQNDSTLSEAAVNVALSQLNEIISYEIEQQKDKQDDASKRKAE